MENNSVYIVRFRAFESYVDLSAFETRKLATDYLGKLDLTEGAMDDSVEIVELPLVREQS